MIAGTDTRLSGLLRKVESGERDAFDSIVRLYWSTVMTFLWKRVPAADAEDLAQDAFIALYKALRKGRGSTLRGEDALRRYLLACARSQVTDYYRRKRLEEPAGALEDLMASEGGAARPDKGREAPDPLVSEEERTAVRDCMGELEVRSRTLCWLHFVDGKSKREIAASLDMPESSFRALFSKILDDLRECLEGKSVL